VRKEEIEEERREKKRREEGRKVHILAFYSYPINKIKNF
jgi:hypothetical protein